VALQTVIAKFGYKIDLRSKMIFRSHWIVYWVKSSVERTKFSGYSIRTMSKAKYSTDNIGHYGLAFDYYSHFTSPIRRYPDVIHFATILSWWWKSADEEIYEAKCLHSSTMEGLATSAERDSIKYMQVKYMQDHKDQEFFRCNFRCYWMGNFVEIIENKCEGM
jgi:ribonuclease R